MSSEQQNVRVVCRFKPLSADERPASLAFSPDGRGVETFAFEKIFRGAKVTNQQVYAQAVGDLAVAAVEGFNVTVFAYGQTGSGKTHTMSGTAEDPGVIPRFLEEVFDRLDGETDAKCETSVQFVEIYNEEIFSLLPDRHGRADEAKKGLTPVINGDRVTVGWDINGVKPRPVNDVGDVMLLFEQGQKRRHTGATMMNDRSSRSHSVLIIEIVRTLSSKKGGKVVRSRVVLVDLAGSERQEKTGATGDRFEEAKNINQSLLTLGNVITTLSEGDQRAHVRYRDSELTKVLQTSLGGNSKTLMIIACSEAESNKQETVSTLRYGARASKVKNAAVVNETMTLEQALAVIEDLKRKLAAGQPAPVPTPRSPTERKRTEDLEGQLVVALKRAEDAEALLEEVQRDMDTAEELTVALEQRAKAAEAEAGTHRKTIADLEQKLADAGQEREAADRLAERLRDQATKAQMHADEMTAGYNSLQKTLHVTEEELDQAKHRLHEVVEQAAADAEDAEKLATHAEKVLAESKQLKKDIALLKDQCARHEEAEQKLQEDRDKARELAEVHRLALEVAKKELAAAARQLADVEDEDQEDDDRPGPEHFRLQSKLLQTAALYEELHGDLERGEDDRKRATGADVKTKECATNTDWTGLKDVMAEQESLKTRVFGHGL